MNLFELKNWKLQIQPEAYALEPFKKIITRDKSKDKSIGIKELAYVFYMADYRSDFASIVDDSERKKEVCTSVGLKSDWKPDKVVEEAIIFYKNMSKTESLILLEDSKKSIGKLSSYIRNINFDDIDVNDKTGDVKPKHDIKKYVDTMKQIPAVIEALKSLEDAVKKEQDVDKGLRGGRRKGLYTDSE